MSRMGSRFWKWGVDAKICNRLERNHQRGADLHLTQSQSEMRGVPQRALEDQDSNLPL